MFVTSESVDDRHLTRYLLGLLPDVEAEALDERSIVDDGVAARLRDLENELVDAYVTGTIDADLRGPFESFYLASPRRREKVRFAERFLRTVDRAADGARGFSRATAPLARSRFNWLLAVAALLALACSALIVQELQLRRQLMDARRENAAQTVQTATMAAQIEAQRGESERTAEALARVRAVQPSGAFALVLSPQTRGIGPVTAVALARGARTVDVDLQLDVDRFPQYEVALKDPATDRVVWRSEALTPNRTRRPPALSVAFPAAALKPQHYAVELSARGADGSVQAVGSYAFRIEPR